MLGSRSGRPRQPGDESVDGVSIREELSVDVVQLHQGRTQVVIGQGAHDDDGPRPTGCSGQGQGQEGAQRLDVYRCVPPVESLIVV